MRTIKNLLISSALLVCNSAFSNSLSSYCDKDIGGVAPSICIGFKVQESHDIEGLSRKFKEEQILINRFALDTKVVDSDIIVNSLILMKSKNQPLIESVVFWASQLNGTKISKSALRFVVSAKRVSEDTLYEKCRSTDIDKDFCKENINKLFDEQPAIMPDINTFIMDSYALVLKKDQSIAEFQTKLMHSYRSNMNSEIPNDLIDIFYKYSSILKGKESITNAYKTTYENYALLHDNDLSENLLTLRVSIPNYETPTNLELDAYSYKIINQGYYFNSSRFISKVNTLNTRYELGMSYIDIKAINKASKFLASLKRYSKFKKSSFINFNKYENFLNDI